MKFSIRDLLWFILVLCLLLAWPREPEYIVCPCCSSYYEYDLWSGEFNER